MTKYLEINPRKFEAKYSLEFQTNFLFQIISYSIILSFKHDFKFYF